MKPIRLQLGFVGKPTTGASLRFWTFFVSFKQICSWYIFLVSKCLSGLQHPTSCEHNMQMPFMKCLALFKIKSLTNASNSKCSKMPHILVNTQENGQKCGSIGLFPKLFEIYISISSKNQTKPQWAINCRTNTFTYFWISWSKTFSITLLHILRWSPTELVFLHGQNKKNTTIKGTTIE